MAYDLIEIGNRLDKIRRLRGFGYRGGQKKFAESFGANEGQYSVWRRGNAVSTIPVPFAINMIEKHLPDMTLDWIYRGIERGLTVELRNQLQALSDSETAPED